MTIETKWYVITAGPCAGKSPIIEYLSFLGYQTCPSLSRVRINVEISKGGTIEEIRSNEVAFQKRVFEMRFNLENRTPVDRLMIFERGMPDCIAYLRHCGQNTVPIVDACKKRTYKGVFLLGQLPYKKDYARVESAKDAAILHKLIEEAYSDLGYNVIEIPVRPIDERAMMILNKIKTL